MKKVLIPVHSFDKAKFFNEVVKIPERRRDSGYFMTFLSFLVKFVYTVEILVNFYYKAMVVLIKNGYKNTSLGLKMTWKVERFILPFLPDEILYPFLEIMKMSRRGKSMKRNGHTGIIIRDCNFINIRSLAQIGNTWEWGSEDRRFKSPAPRVKIGGYDEGDISSWK